MIRIVWTDQAIEDLEAIHDFAGQTFPEYGRLTAAKIVEAVEQLERFPKSGRIVPEFQNANHREIVRPPFRIMYRLRENTVELITIHHSSRLMIQPFDDVE